MREEAYATCGKCGDPIHQESWYAPHDVNMCDDCFEEHIKPMQYYPKCQICEKETDDLFVIEERGRDILYCRACLEQRYRGNGEHIRLDAYRDELREEAREWKLQSA